MRLDFVSRLGYQLVNYICRKEGTEEDGRRGLSRGFGGGACDGGQDGREGGGEAGGSGKVGRSGEGRGGGKGSREGCHEVVTQEVLVDREVFVDRPVPSKPIKIVRHVRQTVKETVIEALLCAMATTNPPLTSSLPSEPAREAETSPKPITATKTVRGRQLKAPTMRLLDIVVCERLADEWGLVLPSASVVHCSMKDCAIRLGDVVACEALAQIASPAGIIDAYVSSTSACLLHNSFEASFIGTTLSRSPDGSETTPEPASRIASPVEEDITPAILTPEEKNGKSGFDVGSIGGCHVVGLAEVRSTTPFLWI